MKVIPIDAFFDDVEKALSEGKSVELRCTGSSMQPYLRGDGSETIVASPFSPDELIRGTVVLFRYKGRYICHRIIQRKEGKLLIQGDGTIAKQEQIPVSDVLGIIHTVVRRNKKPVSTHTKTAQWYWRCWLRLTPMRKFFLLPYRLWLKVAHFLKI